MLNKYHFFKTLIILFFFSIIPLVFPKNIFASEGTIELRSTGNEPYRCYASSIRMLDPEYRILFTCKFILYPAEENVFNYIVWANPIEGSKPIKLGLIGQGRGEFRTRSQFSGLFVTTELNKDERSPTGRIVMRGDVTPIAFLEEVKEYEATPTLTQTGKTTKLTPTPTNASITTGTKEKVFTAFKRAGVAALVAIVALVGLIFAITRSRG